MKKSKMILAAVIVLPSITSLLAANMPGGTNILLAALGLSGIAFSFWLVGLEV